MENGKKPPLESAIQAKIIRELKKAYSKAFIWKAAAGAYSVQGIPDILAVFQGHFFAFEVKRPGIGKLSAIQAATIEKINAAGGTALVVTEPGQALQAIQEWEDSNR